MLSRYYIAAPRQKHRTSPPFGPVSWPPKASPSKLLPISGRFVYFYCTNSSCISICFALSFSVFSLISFEFSDPTFSGAHLRLPRPAASPRSVMFWPHQPACISNCFDSLRTLCTNQHPEIPVNSILINALRTLVKTMGGGCMPRAIFQIQPAIVFNHLQSASIVPSARFRLRRSGGLPALVSFYFFLFLFTSLQGSLSPAIFASISIEESLP
jgi:hypothetical protein